MSTNRDSIRIKRGMSAELPESLPLGELAFCIDTRELWVGSGDGLALKRVTNTEITQHLDEWNALYTEVDERFETKYVDVSAQFSEKFNELCQQFATKSDALDTQFANKYSELSQQFQNKYNNLEREYAQQVHSAMTLSADNKQSIDLLKRDIGTTANIEDLRQLNNQATETLEQLNQVKTELESDVLVIKDIEKDTKKAHIDYEGNHHDSLKDSMDANIDFIKGEFNTTHMTGENITCENTILRHVKQAEMRGHTELNCIKEPSGEDLVLPYEFEDTQDLTLEDTKESGAVNVVLKGNTEVNVLKNPLRDYVVPYEFEEGYDVTLTDTKETGSVQSAILKGQTLVNLANRELKGINVNINNSYYLEKNLTDNINSTKKYLIRHNYSFISGDVSSPLTTILFYDNNWEYLGEIPINESNFTHIITPKEGTTRAKIRLGRYGSLHTSSYIYHDIMLIEYQDGMENWNIPYFEGMQSVRMPVLTTVGKNLFDYEDFKNTVLSGGSTTKYPINLEPNTTYTFSDKTGLWNGSNGYYVNLHLIDENDVKIVQLINSNLANRKSFTFTTSNSNEYYLYIHKNNMESMDMASSDFQIEQGTQATSYEPYKSNILTVNEDVTLRGIGEVRDELDLLTGEVVERIGEIMLDGSEGWSLHSLTDEDYLVGVLWSGVKDVKKSTSNAISDKLIRRQSTRHNHVFYFSDSILLITFDKESVSSMDLKGLTDKLKTLKPTIYYELATESIKTVDLSILDQDGLSVPALSTYNEVTYINTTVPENSLKPLISSKTPEFPVMIKPNTKYSIVADTTTNGFDEIPLTYNLGGAEVETEIGNKVTVIQTPSTLENETFKVTGTGMKLSNVMILEKDLTGKEIPNYTEGMQSVKMPILTTTGKNLYNKNTSFSGWVDSNGDIKKNGAVGAGDNIISDYIKISPTKRYKMSMAHYQWYYDTNKKYIDQSETISADIIPPNNASYVIVGKSISRLNEQLFSTLDSIQLEEGSTSTSYEPYKSNILTVNEDVTLRGIGDVKDTLDLVTGEVTERIGEMILDGSEDWSGWFGSVNELTYGAILTIDGKGEGVFANDRLIDSKILFSIDEVGIWNVTDSRIVIRVNKIEGVDSVSAVKSFLKNEPITIQYQLATPTIKTVDLNIINQNGQKVDKLSTFNGVTYVESSVAENSLKPIISHKDLEYEVLLKPNTKYSIITNPISNEHTNSPISFDLGGQQVETTVGSYCTLVTTPSTLTHDKLVMKGRGNKLRGGVMVIEGDKTGMMFNHFDGMKSVEEFTVKVANNNLFNKDYYDWSKYSGGTGQITGIHEYGGRKNCIFTNPTLFPLFTHVKPNKQYTVKFDTLKLDDNGRGFLGVEFNYTDGTIEQKTRVSNNVGVWETSMATSNASKQIKSITIHNASNGTHGAFIDLDSFVIVEGTSIPQVESRHNSLPLIIPLRSLPNGVSDTLNLVTGEYVQRVAEHVLDGSEGRWELAQDRTNTMRFNCFNLDIPIGVNGSLLKTDKFPYQSPTANDQEGAVMGGGVVSPKVPIISILKTRLSSNDINGFKQWLSQNPITIQYELQEPIVTKLDLAWKDGKLFAYDGKTHIYVDVEGNKLQPMLDIHVPVNIVAELSRLRQEKEQLEISKTQLEKQLSLIQYHNSDLVSNVENLVAENLMLKQQTQDLQNNSSVLQLKNRELSKHQEKLRNENLELQKRAKALTHTTENLHHKLHVVDSVREAGDLELLSSDFELDFRLMEIEFALDIPMTFSAKGVNIMARTPYEMAKTLILGGKYEREDMETKLKLYRDRGKLTVAEYEELIALMDANELA